MEKIKIEEYKTFKRFETDYVDEFEMSFKEVETLFNKMKNEKIEKINFNTELVWDFCGDSVDGVDISIDFVIERDETDLELERRKKDKERREKIERKRKEKLRLKLEKEKEEDIKKLKELMEKYPDQLK